VTFNPFASVPAVSISIVISSSSANVVVDNTAGVAAVTLVFSLASMVNVVLKILVPFLLISIAGLPDVLAVASDALGN